MAQTVAETGAQLHALEEIIVTAQRREETLQRAPVALSVVRGSDLERAQVTQPVQLMTILPALQTQSSGSFTNFFIRGVGAATANGYTDPGVAFNYDGVYIGRATSTQGFFYDLQRVELLKGPQGTLYGRNATGGAINVIPQGPELGRTDGHLTTEVGNYDLIRGEGGVNIAIGDRSAVRLAGQVISRAGYFKDGFDDDKSQAFRVMVLTKPTDDLSIRLAADYYHRGGKGPGAVLSAEADPVFGAGGIVGYTYGPTGIPASAGIHNPATDALLGARFVPVARVFAPPLAEDEHNDNYFWGVNGEINWTTMVGTVTVLPAYREGHLDYRNYPLGFSSDVLEKDAQKSVEVRLTSDNKRALRYLVGGYYYDEDIDASYVFNQMYIAGYQPLKSGVSSLAAFGRLTWAVTDSLRLTGGLRYTRDKRYMDGRSDVFVAACVNPPSPPASPTTPCVNGAVLPNFRLPSELGLSGPPYLPNPIPGTGTLIVSGGDFAVNRRLTNSDVTWRAAVDWDVTPGSMLYASFETGFRSGGFFFTPDDPTFRPETIKAFTAGSKNRFFDNRLQINLEIFHWKYKDQQVSHFSTASNGQAVFITENVGSSVNKGAELDLRFLVRPNTLLSADVQYLDARYGNFVYQAANLGAPPLVGCPAVLGGASYSIDCSGRRPPKAPRWTVNLGAQQTVPLGDAGQLIANFDTHYQTSSLVAADFTPNEIVRPYWTSNASITYQPSNAKWMLTAFVNNIENNRPQTNAFVLINVNLFGSQYLPPRTFGARATVKF